MQAQNGQEKWFGNTSPLDSDASNYCVKEAAAAYYQKMLVLENIV